MTAPDLNPEHAVRIIDLNHSKNQLAPNLNKSVTALAFSNDGRRLALVDDEGIGLICRIGNHLTIEKPLSGPKGIYGLAFNPDDSRLAGVTRELVHLWDVQSGQDILTLRGAPQRPFDNGFNPRIIWSHDGSMLAISNWNSSVSVWSGQPAMR